MEYWIRGPVIGRGAFATVSLASTVSSGELFAVKSVGLANSNSLKKEKAILAKLNSPYIVKYIGDDISCENGEFKYNLFMEYVPEGTISDAIKKCEGFLDECVIRSYTRQIVQGLDYLHMNNLVHCDIKSSNILVSKNGVKIADFGCAKNYATSIFAGTPVFMAPEVARGEEQSFPADIWSLGCAIIEMASGFTNPWPEVTEPISALYTIGFSDKVPECPKCLRENAKDFLSKCLIRDPRYRWTAKQLLDHPFLEKNCDSSFNQESAKSSPISVLNQDFWDSIEVAQTHESSSNMLSSPIERIGILIQSTPFSSSSSEPDWSMDETWITIRSNIKDEVSDQSALPSSSLIREDKNEDLNLNLDFVLLELVFEDCVVNYSFGHTTGDLSINCDSLTDDFVSTNYNNLKQIMIMFCLIQFQNGIYACTSQMPYKTFNNTPMGRNKLRFVKELTFGYRSK